MSDRMDKNTSVQQERARDLLESVNDSAALARSLYFTYLLILAYVGITIASTTDTQLLLVAPVNLPILNVELPIVDFYILVPWVFVLIHFYLLLQLYLLARRVHLFNDAVRRINDFKLQSEQRAKLFPFPFVHMLAGGNSTFLRALYSAIVWITLVWLPMVLVLASQVRFLPYHDALVTGSARTAVLFELAMLWVFWPLILNESVRTARQWWKEGLTLPVAWFRGLSVWFTKAGKPRDRTGARGFCWLGATTLGVLVFAWMIAVLPGEPMERWMAFLFPLPEDARTEDSTLSGNALTYWMFDGPNAPFHRNLELENSLLIANTVDTRDQNILRQTMSPQRPEILDNIAGLNLAGRDLRYASFYGSILVNADLRGANLDGADLRNAFLDRVDMRPLEVSPGAECIDDTQKQVTIDGSVEGVEFISPNPVFCVTSAREAKFSRARLVSADAQMALFNQSDFTFSELAEIHLGDADLRNTLMRRTGMGSVNLTNALTSGIRILGYSENPVTLRVESLDLTGADLRSVNLDETEITSAALARFSSVSLRRVDFSGADIHGASFYGADLRNADFSGANIQGASFEDVDLRGADLSEVKGDLAVFTRTQVCMADWRGASLQGTSWNSSAWDGSTMPGVDLRFSRLYSVKASASDLRESFLQPSFASLLDLSFSDIRGLNLPTDPEPGPLLELAADLRDETGAFSNWQESMLTALDDDQTVRGESTITLYADQPLLCDETAGGLQGNQQLSCLTEDQRLMYLNAILPVACSDANIMSGMIKIIGSPGELRSTRGGIQLDAGEESEFFEALVEGIEDCPALDGLGAPAQNILARTRTILAGKGDTREAPEESLPEAPCEW